MKLSIFWLNFCIFFCFSSCKSDVCKDALIAMVSEWNGNNIRTSENFEIDFGDDATNIYIYEKSKFGSNELQDLTITDLTINICECENKCVDKPVFINYILPSTQFENSTKDVTKTKEVKLENCEYMIDAVSKDKRKLLKYIVENFKTDDEREISDASKVLSRLYAIGDSTKSGLTVYFNYLNLHNSSENSNDYWNIIAINKILEESKVGSQIHLDSINSILGISKPKIDWNELDSKFNLR